MDLLSGKYVRRSSIWPCQNGLSCPFKLEKKFNDFTLYFLAFNHEGKELTSEEKQATLFSREGLSLFFSSWHQPWIFGVIDPVFLINISKACLSLHTTMGLNQTPISKATPMETPTQAEDSGISLLPSMISTRLVSDSTNLVSSLRNDSPMVKWVTSHLFWILMGKLVIDPNVTVKIAEPAFVQLLDWGPSPRVQPLKRQWRKQKL